ncbi:MAG: DnaJ domain-containing protein [Cyanobacteria bacterium SZAS LIN-3]|nr:DnaJ domain-containing protein [Cyanobacteria bacterium SZAS LIN-3]MBS2008211.1 DnaJ domain-containing protein [Cyanobacteria bacterium SZAS TMP-1]
MVAQKKPTYYEVLGVAPGVSREEIKVAYRQLVKVLHPDPSYKEKSDHQVVAETEQMMYINEAYATLIDNEKRAHYNSTMIYRRNQVRMPTHMQDSFDEEKATERYLRQVFNPLVNSIVKILKKYKQRLKVLAQDLYDEVLLEEFALYVDEIENTLRKASNGFTDNPAPLTLKNAVTWMRHAIAQAADGLDELRFFCQNFDYDHLAMADNLFKIAIEHSTKAKSMIRAI